jgi:hypothetical protein
MSESLRGPTKLNFHWIVDYRHDKEPEMLLYKIKIRTKRLVDIEAEQAK